MPCGSIIFFGLKNPFFAFVEIILLWVAILLTILKFLALSRPAAILVDTISPMGQFRRSSDYFYWGIHNSQVVTFLFTANYLVIGEATVATTCSQEGDGTLWPAVWKSCG